MTLWMIQHPLRVRGRHCRFDGCIGDLRGEFSPARTLNHPLSCLPHFIDVRRATVAGRPERAEEKKVRKVLLGAVLMLVILLLSGLALMQLGLMPVNADGSHSSLEARIMPRVLHASIVRHASADTNPLAVNEENLKEGASTYKAMCARCHSTLGGNPSVYGQSFYPPAPRLAGGMSNYTDSQLFWTIKHGIRNTGMPAWGAMLSDDEIWQIVSLLKNSQDLPPSVESE
jgi:mono/diheme cytochrome c family protein